MRKLRIKISPKDKFKIPFGNSNQTSKQELRFTLENQPINLTPVKQSLSINAQSASPIANTEILLLKDTSVLPNATQNSNQNNN
jgi:hypothetical protein